MTPAPRDAPAPALGGETLPEQGSGFLSRFFRKTDDLAASARQELSISEPTVGLCFNYERGLNYDSEYLADVGLEDVMKVLQRHKLRATFHCPAKLCETSPKQIEMILQAGHEVAALGYANEMLTELTPEALKQLAFTCRNAFLRLKNGYVGGFRSPRSSWSDRMGPELLRQHFVYDAEHDHAKRPYLLVAGKNPLIRIPIRTDDRYLRSMRRDKREEAISKHHRVVRKAVQGRHFVAVCFHPWSLAEESFRMQHWLEWLDTALQMGVKALALEDVLPPELRSAKPVDEAPQ